MKSSVLSWGTVQVFRLPAGNWQNHREPNR